ncbi:hypothetical protein [Burkholderia multivorans]|uniref:hypothetical protein n=1 Tax=Burkholderia multivorans TaxID=87883 RepID=UPI000D00D516|nr:hypothetical protein [Burkholderia multivorans]MBU9123439.1 hypothetical protein [Burkholderia multivorans]PRF42511.1 hypothetical protein C6Q04_29960 [Burkholderia multivorans]PRG50798.1 hypothetical protein C6T63_17865 [Burkholderia multivorans]
MALNFDVFAIETQTGVVAVKGENMLDAGIRQSLVTALDVAFTKGISRERVAEAMAETLGRPITKAQIDLWVAPSQADRRIPTDAFLALIGACQEFSPLDWIAAHFGRKVLTADEALCAELGAMTVIDRHIKAKQRAIEGQMDEKLLGQIIRRIKKNGLA